MDGRALAALAVALVALTAGCLGAVGTAPSANARTAPTDDGAMQLTPAPGEPGAAVPTVTVQATGRATADPDAAVVRVAVEATGTSANRATDRVAADADRLRDALRDAGVADEDVRTRYFNVGPDYRDGERSDPERYRAVHTFEIRTTPDRAGRIVDVATDGGADRVDGVSFTLSAERERELRADAIREAVADGRADAEALTDAAGVELDGLQQASTGSGGVVPYEVRGGADASGTTLEPGPVTVTARVSLTYAVA